VHLWQVSVNQPLFLFVFFSFFFLRCSRWQGACLVPCPFLHLRKKLRNDNKPPGSPSSITPEKKNKEMTISQGGLLSSTTHEKKKKWWQAKEARHHLLHMRKKTKKRRRTREVRHHLLHLRKCRRWQQVGRLSTRCHLLGFFSNVNSLTTSPFDASLGFYELTNYITTWCISWVFVISLVATLALGSRPRQRGCKGAGQKEAWESHHILLGV